MNNAPREDNESVKIIDFGCGFQDRAKTCWVDHGLAKELERKFPGNSLEVTGLDLWWDKTHDFDFKKGRFFGTMEANDLPKQADGIVWRYPNPRDIGYDELDTDESSVLAAIQKLIRERLTPGGSLFFETDLTNEQLIVAIEAELGKTGLIKVGTFKTQGSFYEHHFGAEYMKKAA